MEIIKLDKKKVSMVFKQDWDSLNWPNCWVIFIVDWVKIIERFYNDEKRDGFIKQLLPPKDEYE